MKNSSITLFINITLLWKISKAHYIDIESTQKVVLFVNNIGFKSSYVKII